MLKVLAFSALQSCTEAGPGVVMPDPMSIGGDVERLVILSPGFPGSYPPNSDCHWDFESSGPGYVIEIEVLFWEV